MRKFEKVYDFPVKPFLFFLRSGFSPDTIYTVIRGEVYKSTDFKTWTHIYTFPIPAGIEVTVVAAPTRAICYVYYRDIPALFKTTDGGLNWTNIITSIPGVRKDEVWILQFETPTEGFLFTTESGAEGIWKTIDGGLSWKRVLSTFDIEGAEFVFFGNKGFIIGSTMRPGYWWTVNRGETWTYHLNDILARYFIFSPKKFTNWAFMANLHHIEGASICSVDFSGDLPIIKRIMTIKHTPPSIYSPTPPSLISESDNPLNIREGYIGLMTKEERILMYTIENNSVVHTEYFSYDPAIGQTGETFDFIYLSEAKKEGGIRKFYGSVIRKCFAEAYELAALFKVFPHFEKECEQGKKLKEWVKV